MLERQIVKQEMDDYRVQLNAYVDSARLFARQGFAFDEHGESESSTNEEHFLQLLKFLGDHNEQIGNVILENDTKNLKLTSPDILKDIVNVAAEEINREVIAELGDELFSVFIDVSRDVSGKDQMAVVIRFVNKRGSDVERFLGIGHVSDTADTVDTVALSLKTTLENLFGKHGLTLSRLRGQFYDGASEMTDEFNGLKTLITRENGSAYYVHCFADQLQLILVAVAKNQYQVCLLFQMVSSILNVVCAPCKRCDGLRDKRAIEVVEALSNDEILMGRGLNLEMDLSCAGDTRWSSHFKALNSVITLFSAMIDVIEEVENDGSFQDHRIEACRVLDYMQSFEFVFNCHLMRNALLITCDISQTLQSKDPDIVNVMYLVKIAKSRLQKMRDSGWESLVQEVCAFCEKNNIEIPNMEDLQAHKSRHRATDITNLHYYRVEIFYTVIDMQLQELNSRFTETTIELLICIGCLDPNNSFPSFNKDRLLQLAQFYPSDFNRWELAVLESQLENYYMDLQSDRDFLEVRSLVELSQKMVEKNKHNVFPLVYKLVKLALILPVDTASVERAFLAMNVVKICLRNRMGDQWMNDCLVTYIERDLFDREVNERIIQRFENMKTRNGRLASLT